MAFLTESHMRRNLDACSTKFTVSAKTYEKEFRTPVFIYFDKITKVLPDITM